MLNTAWPFFGWIDDIRPALRAAQGNGENTALATIVRTSGSAPRTEGTQMLFRGDQAVGYFSGSCIEADVATHAHATLVDGTPRHLVYGQGSPWMDIRLACGGRLEILVERIPADDEAAGRLLRCADERTPVVWQSDGISRGLTADAIASPAFRCSPEPQFPSYAKRYDPAFRLIVVGGDPAALATAQLGVEVGYEVTLIRHKGPEGCAMAGLSYSRENPKVIFSRFGFDRWTALAVATHDLAVDHDLLVTALPSDAFYVGALGARDRVNERKARLLSAGIGEPDLARLRAPIGLEACGKTPWQVAVSIIADIMQQANRRS